MPITPARIILQHSTVSGYAPADTDLTTGEFFINIPDNKLFYLNPDLIEPVVEISLMPTYDQVWIKDLDLDGDGNLVATKSDNQEISLGNVIGPAGRGLAIDGVVDYAEDLPTNITSPVIPNVLNKNGTMFIVRYGLDSLTLFSPGGPRIYTYNADGDGAWTELEDASVSAMAEPSTIIVTADMTAVAERKHTVIANATISDPTPGPGLSYSVFVRNGIANVGGTAYSIPGTQIVRSYYDGLWENYYYLPE